MAWGGIAAIIAKLAFNLTENEAWLFACLPTMMVSIPFLWKRLPRILGFSA